MENLNPMVALFYVMRVRYKLFMLHYLHKPTNSFCKVCGRDVRDFSVSDELWAKIAPLIKRGNIVCYNCFCDLCRQAGLPAVWELKERT